jgi:hypothetical protein
MKEPVLRDKPCSRPAPPPRATAALLYWLLVASGIAALTLGPAREFADLVALAAAALMGTGLGQLLARGRLRPWLVALIVTNLAWFGFAMIAPFGWFRDQGESWGSVELAVMTFVPAVLCAYASLTERGALVAFWFPAALFMVPVLEGAGSGAASTGSVFFAASGELGDRDTWVLASILTVLFVAFLRARETRRVALWRRHAAERLSLTRPKTTLREAPLRSLAQGGFVVTTAAMALVLTAWIAPHLWQKEKLAKHPVPAPTSQALQGSSSFGQQTEGAGQGLATAGGAPCCATPEADVTRDRYKEYFPIRAHEGLSSSPAVPAGCVPCGQTGTSPPGIARGSSFGGAGSSTPTTEMEPRAPTHWGSPSSAARPPSNQELAAVPTAPRTPPSQAAPLPTFAPPPTLAVTETAMRGVAVTGTAEEVDPLLWLMTFAVSALGLELVLRPIRRLLMLRHLRSGLWLETVDQRVSNLWQLALVGLRDAGFCAVVGEQPEELASRVGVPTMEACATILERARHGVRVDAQDLELMRQGAVATYRSARRGIGWSARALSWLRWPLV